MATAAINHNREPAITGHDTTASAPPVPLLFTVDHAAALLGVCVKTLRRETMIGRMPCARVGPGKRAIRYSLEHVQEYIRRCDDDGSIAGPWELTSSDKTPGRYGPRP